MARSAHRPERFDQQERRSITVTRLESRTCWGRRHVVLGEDGEPVIVNYDYDVDRSLELAGKSRPTIACCVTTLIAAILVVGALVLI